MKFAADRVEGLLRVFRAVVDQWAAIGSDCIAKKFADSDLPLRRIVVQVADDFSTQKPEVVHVLANGLWGKTRGGQMLDEGSEAGHQLFSWRQVFFQPHPGARPAVQIAAVGGCIRGRCRGRSTVYFGNLRLENRPRHGIEHDSKSLPSSSRICLPTGPLWS